MENAPILVARWGTFEYISQIDLDNMDVVYVCISSLSSNTNYSKQNCYVYVPKCIFVLIVGLITMPSWS